MKYLITYRLMIDLVNTMTGSSRVWEDENIQNNQRRLKRRTYKTVPSLSLYVRMHNVKSSSWRV